MKMETIRACSIWRALEIVGDVATLLILEQAFLGTHRFDDFVAKTGVARSVISSRLKSLVLAGVLEHKSAHVGRRKVYRLTIMGRGLFPAALMILRWQHRWEPDQREFSIKLVHRDCGHAMKPKPACGNCSETIDPRHVTWVAGPGLRQVTPIYGRRRAQTKAASARRETRSMVDSVIELFGDRWMTLIVRACFTNVVRFDDIQRDTLMATNVLSDRLERLIGQGILKTVQYSTYQGRFEYRLTEKGRDLYPVLLALLEWGDQWFADTKGPPLLLSHVPCGAPLQLAILCSHCDSHLSIENVAFMV